MQLDRRSFIGLAMASSVVSAEELSAFNALAATPPLDLNPTTIAVTDPGPFYLDIEGFGFIVNGVLPTMLAGAAQTVIHIPSGTVVRDNTGNVPEKWVDINVLGDTLDQCCAWPYPAPAPAKLGEPLTAAYEEARKFLLFIARDVQTEAGRMRLKQKHASLRGKQSTYTDWYN